MVGRNQKKTHLPILPCILFVQYAAYLAFLHLWEGIQAQSLDFPNVVAIVTGAIAALLFGFVTDRTVSCSTRLRKAVTVAAPTFNTILFLYHFRVKTSLSFSTIADNFFEFFSTNSFFVILQIFGKKDYVHLVLAISIFLWIANRFIPRTESSRLIITPAYLFSFFTYISILTIPIPVYDEITYFFQSAIHGSSDIEKYSELFKRFDTSAYPFLTNNPSSPKKMKSPPHVFIVALESFNSGFVGQRENGMEVTPFLNSLIDESLYVENFYGNSIQTAKGHFALLCGLLPMVRGKAFYTFQDTQFYCLPEILGDHGMTTIFFQGYENRNFDMTSQFALANGFQHFFTADRQLLSEVERERNVWGWGIQDNLIFRQFFNTIDELECENSHRKFFGFVATISNHMRFRSIPADQKLIFKNLKTSHRENFINSIHLSDLYLRSFFDELSAREYLNDSVVIVTGDHSYPSGEHGYIHSETQYFDESFRVPLVIWSPSRITPRRVASPAYSQVDVAPTLLDLLDLDVTHHFIGTSVLSKGESNIVHLIQPYDGIYLGVVDYPLKYVSHVRTRREFLFDLACDPLEFTNLIHQHGDSEEVRAMREEIGFIFFNTKVIESNRVWNQP